MKKLFITTLVVGVLSTSAFAWVDGKIGKINTVNDGSFVVEVIPSSGPAQYRGLNASGDAKKQMIALILSAKASNADVSLHALSGKWVRAIYK
jgi:hypothetical protein